MRRPHLASTSASITASAVLLLALAGCGDDTSDAARTGTSESPSPSATTSQEPSPSASAKPRPKPKQEPDEVSVDVTVQGDQVSPNAEVLEVEVGEPITLQITSDRPGELHIHSSPEQYVEFGAGRTTERFTVERPGSVEVEEHDSGAQILRVLAQ
jgi:hypothetical protein